MTGGTEQAVVIRSTPIPRNTYWVAAVLGVISVELALKVIMQWRLLSDCIRTTILYGPEKWSRWQMKSPSMRPIFRMAKTRFYERPKIKSDGAGCVVSNSFRYFLYHTCPLNINSGCEKREAHKKLVHCDTWKGITIYSNYLDYWLCAGGLSAVNANGTQWRDPINSGLIQWRLMVHADAVAEKGRNSVSKHQIDDLAQVWRMSGLTRMDGTAEPVSRDQILRRERGQGNDMFPVQLNTCRIGNQTRLIQPCWMRWPYIIYPASIRKPEHSAPCGQ